MSSMNGSNKGRVVPDGIEMSRNMEASPMDCHCRGRRNFENAAQPAVGVLIVRLNGDLMPEMPYSQPNHPTSPAKGISKLRQEAW
jgi:hypothetical protein